MLSASKVKPINEWNKGYISPGGVGPVGDVLLATRLKRSSPDDMPLFITRRDYGSNIVDGNNQMMYRLGAGPRMSFKTFDRKVGLQNDLTQYHPEDRTMMPLIQSHPQYSWNNQIANAFKVNAKEFSIAPTAYGPVNGVSRGPTPRRVVISQADVIPTFNTNNVSTQTNDTNVTKNSIGTGRPL